MITDDNGGARKSRRLSFENITMAIYELAGTGVLLRTPGETIEFRMCEGVKGQLGKNNAQAIADATRCVVKAYSMKVNMFGTFVKHLFTVYGKLNIRHSLWSDGTITVYKPWENNREKTKE